jgi:hypothetical protein
MTQDRFITSDNSQALKEIRCAVLFSAKSAVL